MNIKKIKKYDNIDIQTEYIKGLYKNKKFNNSLIKNNINLTGLIIDIKI